MSLKRTLKNEESAEIVNELADYFSKLIFNLVDVDKDDEIELPLIRNVSFYIKLQKQYWNMIYKF